MTTKKMYPWYDAVKEYLAAIRPDAVHPADAASPEILRAIAAGIEAGGISPETAAKHLRAAADALEMQDRLYPPQLRQTTWECVDLDGCEEAGECLHASAGGVRCTFRPNLSIIHECDCNTSPHLKTCAIHSNRSAR